MLPNNLKNRSGGFTGSLATTSEETCAAETYPCE